MGQFRVMCPGQAKAVWATVMEHDTEMRDLPGLVTQTMGEGVWGGAEQVAICAEALGASIHIHELSDVINKFGSGGLVTKLLYSSAAKGRGTPDHYDLIWPKGQSGEGKLAEPS